MVWSPSIPNSELHKAGYTGVLRPNWKHYHSSSALHKFASKNTTSGPIRNPEEAMNYTWLPAARQARESELHHRSAMRSRPPVQRFTVALEFAFGCSRLSIDLPKTEAICLVISAQRKRHIAQRRSTFAERRQHQLLLLRSDCSSGHASASIGTSRVLVKQELLAAVHQHAPGMLHCGKRQFAVLLQAIPDFSSQFENTT